MNHRKIYILLIAATTMLFVGLVLLGSYFWIENQRGVAIVLFLLAFASVIGQMMALALYLRKSMRSCANLQHQQESSS